MIVTGTPGVGKTSVSKQLAAKLSGLHIDLGELVRREKLTSGYDRKRQTLIADERKLANRLQQILKQRKGIVVIDGHYATAVIQRSQVERVFVLRRDPRQLKQQMKERGVESVKLLENLTAEILDIVLYEAVKDMHLDKVCEVDATSRTVEDTVSEILSLYRGERRCLVGVVDWIGKLEKEGVLDEYLSC